MDPFTIEIDQRDETLVARLAGDASNVHADQIRTALAKLAEEQANQVVVDLRELTFIASMSLAELIELSHKLNDKGTTLRLCGATADIEGVFRTTHLNRFFPMFPSVEDAIAGK